MKLPFSLSVNYLIKLIAPSLILSLSCIPFFEIMISKLGTTISVEMVVLIFIFLFSCMFLGFDDPIYMILEGRRYWPNWLKKCRINVQAKRLQKLINKKNQYIDAKGEKHALQRHDINYLKYLEIVTELDRYPVDENGEHYVIYPTRIGNLLIAYEDYSFRIYGMDSSFYFYRIWLLIDDSIRKEIDGLRSIADGMIYCIIAFSLSAILCFIYALIATFKSVSMININNPLLFYMLCFVLIILASLWYNLSLHVHYRFGELFKSVFDIYRKKVPLDDILLDIFMEKNAYKDKEIFKEFSFAKKSMHVVNILKVYKHLKRKSTNRT